MPKIFLTRSWTLRVPRDATNSRASSGRRRRTWGTTTACTSSHKAQNSGYFGHGETCGVNVMKDKKCSRNRTELSQVCQDAGTTETVTKRQFFVTRSAIALGEQCITSSCREHTHPRDEFKKKKNCSGRLDQFWMYWLPKAMTDTELRSKLVQWSSSAGVLNGMLRSLFSMAPSRCESTQPHWAR